MENRYGMDIGACGLTLQLEFANSAQLNSFVAATISFPHFVGDARSREPHRLSDPLLMPPNESLHFLEGDGAIVVGIHGSEDALVRRLKLLQCEFPVSVGIHQTEN